MSKTSKRNRGIIRNAAVQNPPAQTSPKTYTNKQPTILKLDDSNQLLKNDLKWSAITGGFVVIVLIILYIFFH
jgi:uncharacterized integral membrane protein